MLEQDNYREPVLCVCVCVCVFVCPFGLNPTAVTANKLPSAPGLQKDPKSEVYNFSASKNKD